MALPEDWGAAAEEDQVLQGRAGEERGGEVQSSLFWGGCPLLLSDLFVSHTTTVDCPCNCCALCAALLCDPPQVDSINWLRDEVNRLEDAILMERDAALV